jgi:2-isopropylmalate synthase
LVGADKSEIILTARSGRHGLKHRLMQLGFDFNETRFEALYNYFLEMADKKSEIGDDDLRELVAK